MNKLSECCIMFVIDACWLFCPWNFTPLNICSLETLFFNKQLLMFNSVLLVKGFTSIRRFYWQLWTLPLTHTPCWAVTATPHTRFSLICDVKGHLQDDVNPAWCGLGGGSTRWLITPDVLLHSCQRGSLLLFLAIPRRVSKHFTGWPQGGDKLLTNRNQSVVLCLGTRATSFTS